MKINAKLRERIAEISESNIYMTSLVHSFRGYWAIPSLILNAVAITNALQRYFSLPLGKIIDVLLTTYRTIFHIPIDFLMFWCPIEIPPMAKDIFVIYAILGAVTIRSAGRYEKAGKGTRKTNFKWSSPDDEKPRTSVTEKPSTFLGKLKKYFLHCLIWPYYWWILFMRPEREIRQRVFWEKHHWFFWRETVSKSVLLYKINFRIVFFYEMVAVILCVISFLFLW